MSDTHCAACDVGLPVGSRKDTCAECRQPFCASCIVLKSKLQKTSAVGRKNKCMCQQFISSKLPKRGQNRSPVRSTPHDELTKERTHNDCLSYVKGSQQKGISTESRLKNKNMKTFTAKSVTCEGNTSVYVKNGPVTEHEDVSNEDRHVRFENEDEESKDAVLIEERDKRFEREDQKVDDRAVALPRPRPTRKRTDVSSSHDASTDPEELLEASMPFFAQILRSTNSTQSRRPTTEDDFASLREGLSPPAGESDDELIRLFPMVYQMLGGFLRPPPRPVEGLSPPGESSEEVMRMVPLLNQMLDGGFRAPPRQPCPGCRNCDRAKRIMNQLTSNYPILLERMRSFPPAGESVMSSVSKMEDEMCDITNENVDDIPPLGQLSQELIANGGYGEKFLKIATYKQIQKNMLEENEKRNIMADVLLDDLHAKRAAERPELLGAAETETNRSQASVDSSQIPEQHTVRENASLLPIETDVSDTKLVTSEPSFALENDKDKMDTGVMLKKPIARDNSTLFPNEKGDEERNQVPNKSLSAVENNDEMDKDLMRRQRLKRFETKSALVEPQNKPDNRDSAPNMHSAPRTMRNRVLKPVLPIETNDKSQNLLQNGHTSTLSDVNDSVDVNDQTYRGSSQAQPRLNQNQDSSKIETTVGDQTTSPMIKVCDTDAGSGELCDFEDENILDEKDIPTAMKAYLISQGKWNPNRNRNVVSRRTPTLNKKHTQPATGLQQRLGMTRPTKSVGRGLSQSDGPRQKQGQLGQSGSEDQSYRSDARHTSGTSSQMHQIAEMYDRAFKSLKVLESSKQTCPACGSPDCRNVLGFSKNTLQDQARINGLEVVDVLPDGNCMFAAVVDQLQAHDVHEFTTWNIRQKVVQWLKDNPKCPDDQDTHFQAFMSEPWEKYLERMAQDGQWGDHVTIRAIANVLGCTVKILNVNGKTTNWTVIEPGTETKAVIILGHIGEFHYTSLRQAASQLTSSALGNDIDVHKQSKLMTPDLLDVKKVVLFKKDHFDRPSGLPICCWNFAINSILPRKRLLSVTKSNSSLYMGLIDSQQNAIETSTRTLPPHTFVTTGCAAQGTFLPFHCRDASSKDNMFNWTPSYLRIVYDRVFEHPYRLEGSGSLCHHGFSRIFYGTDGLHIYIPNDTYRNALRSVPTLPFTFSSHYFPNVIIEVHTKTQFAIAWPDWPEAANEWLTRKRYAGWPSSKMIEEVASKGCLMEPVPHIDSADPNMEWKFCFDEAITILFREGISEHQRHCFLVLFTLCFRSLNGIENCTVDLITNVFFVCCERCPPEYWQRSPGGCIMFMLNTFMRCLKERFLPNYFIPSNNLIDCLSTSDINAISEKVIEMRRDPLKILRQVEHCAWGVASDGLYDNVRQESQRFSSVKESTLSCFVPCSIDFAKFYVNRIEYDTAYETLVEAFESRQSVSTCEDNMSLQSFVLVCFNGIDLNSRVWFATYLENQLGSSIIRDVCSDFKFTQIEKIIPKDIAVSYGHSEVPLMFSYSVDFFCHDFAAFLVFMNKDEEALPVLYHCHKLYQHHQSALDTRSLFSDETMICVYAGIFALHKKANETAIFNDLLDSAFSTTERLNEVYGFAWLAEVCTELSDTVRAKACKDKASRQADVNQSKLRQLIFWPTKYIM